MTYSNIAFGGINILLSFLFISLFGYKGVIYASSLIHLLAIPTYHYYYYIILKKEIKYDL
jgi:O-antigen/teichoic acid export membrane protein